MARLPPGICGRAMRNTCELRAQLGNAPGPDKASWLWGSCQSHKQQSSLCISNQSGQLGGTWEATHNMEVSPPAPRSFCFLLQGRAWKPEFLTITRRKRGQGHRPGKRLRILRDVLLAGGSFPRPTNWRLSHSQDSASLVLYLSELSSSTTNGSRSKYFTRMNWRHLSSPSLPSATPAL